MVTDSHTHLDDPALGSFLQSIRNIRQNAFPNPLRLISNSANLESSRRNVDLGKELEAVVPFVGVHPQFFLQHDSPKDLEGIRTIIEGLGALVKNSSGIGEIGLDPGYGEFELQCELFKMQLEIAEKNARLPVSIHTRGAIPKTIEILSTFKLSNAILFHWFAGTENELARIQDLGFFSSYGPIILYSRRMAMLVKMADERTILAETDSPLIFSSILKGEPITPFLITSVLFRMAQVRSVSYEKMLTIHEENVDEYLGAQNSLRLMRH